MEQFVDDRALVAAAQAGDRDALDRLIRAHYDRIHAVCRRITGNESDAADATQEALIAMVRGLHRFDGRSAFSTWVYRIATNASLDELRRRRRRPLSVVHDDDRADLEARFEQKGRQFGENVPRPEHWGGYRLIPAEIEFWQGRRTRLHDRLRYRREGETGQTWMLERLAP